MKFPLIMESQLKYVWMTAAGEGFVIKLKIIRPFNPKAGDFDNSWFMDHFEECNDPIKRILLGKIKR